MPDRRTIFGGPAAPFIPGVLAGTTGPDGSLNIRIAGGVASLENPSGTGDRTGDRLRQKIGASGRWR